MTDKTMTFRIGDDHEDVMKETLTEVFDALQEKGYNPINQIVGYILTEDPTYITLITMQVGLLDGLTETSFWLQW